MHPTTRLTRRLHEGRDDSMRAGPAIFAIFVRGGDVSRQLVATAPSVRSRSTLFHRSSAHVRGSESASERLFAKSPFRRTQIRHTSQIQTRGCGNRTVTHENARRLSRICVTLNPLTPFLRLIVERSAVPASASRLAIEHGTPGTVRTVDQCGRNRAFRSPRKNGGGLAGSVPPYSLFELSLCPGGANNSNNRDKRKE